MTFKYPKYFYLLIVLFSLAFIQCKKNPLDKRSKYIGDWTFTYTYTYPGNGYQTSSESKVTISIDPQTDHALDQSHILIEDFKCSIFKKAFHDEAKISGMLTGKFLSKTKLVLDPYPGTTVGSNVMVSVTGVKNN